LTLSSLSSLSSLSLSPSLIHHFHINRRLRRPFPTHTCGGSRNDRRWRAAVEPAP
jgi:hypothetical protein